MSLQDDWEAILKAEGMPAEIRLLTHSSEAAGSGLICVSASDRPQSSDDNRIQFSKEWTMNANIRIHGKPTSISDLDNAEYWRLFSTLIWESGITGTNLSFLLDYAEHGFVIRSRQKFNVTRRHADRLIAFVWEGNRHNGQSNNEPARFVSEQNCNCGGEKPGCIGEDC